MVQMNRSLLRLLAISFLQTLSAFLQVSSSASITMFTATNTAKPGCQSKCGNLTISYPFGINKGCAMGEEYLIRCYQEDNGDFTPQFLDTISKVLEISENQITVAAGRPVASSCKSPEEGNDWGKLNLTRQPYALSSSGNKFMVVGCQNYGLIETTTGFGKQIISCVTLCKKKEDLLDKACAGVGCCQVPIPPGLQSFDTSLETIRYNTSISSGNCSYSFVVKRTSFEFHGADELKSPGFVDKLYNMPVVLDWFIGNNSCEYARRHSSSFACKKNTVCVDVSKALNVKGYHCKCLDGYEGNPYLSPGCTGLSIGLGFILFVLGGYWGYRTTIRRKEIKIKAENFKRNGGLWLQKQMSSEETTTHKAKIFTTAELEKATDKFNEDREQQSTILLKT